LQVQAFWTANRTCKPPKSRREGLAPFPNSRGNGMSKNQRIETLLKIQNFYIDEAKKCYEAKAYFAGCVMLGSVLEATLLIIVALYPEEVNTLKKFPKRGGKPTSPINWSLSYLLDVARELNWLPGKLERTNNYDSPEKGEIGDDARIIHEIRNLVHPGKYLRCYPSVDITEKHFYYSFIILNLINDRLQNKLVEKDVYFPND